MHFRSRRGRRGAHRSCGCPNAAFRGRKRRSGRTQILFWRPRLSAAFRPGRGGGLGFAGIGQVQVTSAIFTELDVCSVFEGHHRCEGDLHVAAGASLAADGGDALFSLGGEAIVVAEDLGGDFGAQFGGEGFGIFFGGFFEFDSLKPDEVLQ